MTADEVIDFLAKLDADEEARTRDLPDLVRLFIATGERRGEALGAHWSDFDPDAQTLTMTGNIVQVRGKSTVRNRGKSETSNRTIPLPAWCVELLKERQAKVGMIDPDKPIFPNSQGGYVNASNLTNRHWVPFRERAGYDWVTFHPFRKTVGTLLDDAGLTARQIADVFGSLAPVDDALQLHGPRPGVTGERRRPRLDGDQAARVKTGNKSATGFDGSRGVPRADSRKPAVTSGFSVLLSQPDARPKGFEPLTF